MTARFYRKWSFFKLFNKSAIKEKFMKNYLEDINSSYPVRRTDEEKERFRAYAVSEAEALGAKAKNWTDKGKKHKNVVIGNPDKAKVTLVAHYDTPAASPFPNLMLPRSPVLFWLYQFVPLLILIGISLGAGFLAEVIFDDSKSAFFFGFLFVYYLLYFLFFRTFKNKNNKNDNTSGVATLFSVLAALSESERDNVCFILFDNEEKGKLGSRAYFKENREIMKNMPVINFDCVGNGKSIIFIAQKKAEECREFAALKESFTPCEEFAVHFHGKRGSEANSDHKSFPLGIACVASKSTKGGILYTPNIHTARDTVASDANIEFITGGIVNFLSKI